jgi:hypothetical protein
MRHAVRKFLPGPHISQPLGKQAQMLVVRQLATNSQNRADRVVASLPRCSHAQSMLRSKRSANAFGSASSLLALSPILQVRYAG